MHILKEKEFKVKKEKIAESETGGIGVGSDTMSALLVVAKANAQTLPDTLALQVRALYPDWEDVIGEKVENGFKFNYEAKTYKVITPGELIIQEQHVPGIGTESLYMEISETHVGTKK